MLITLMTGVILSTLLDILYQPSCSLFELTEVYMYSLFFKLISVISGSFS